MYEYLRIYLSITRAIPVAKWATISECLIKMTTGNSSEGTPVAKSIEDRPSARTSGLNRIRQRKAHRRSRKGCLVCRQSKSNPPHVVIGVLTQFEQDINVATRTSSTVLVIDG